MKMKITIEQVNSNPSSTMMAAYTKGNSRPVAYIYEEDFINQVLTDRQYTLLEKGAIVFNVPESKLFEASKQWFNQNR